MSESIYQQVERAIRERLVLSGRYPKPPFGSPSKEYPVRIEHGNIVLRDCDCGLAKGERVITTDEWERLARPGLLRMVGMWDFVSADDPAADDVQWCHTSPGSAGQRLYELRQRVAELEARLEESQGAA